MRFPLRSALSAGAISLLVATNLGLPAVASAATGDSGTGGAATAVDVVMHGRGVAQMHDGTADFGLRLHSAQPDTKADGAFRYVEHDPDGDVTYNGVIKGYTLNATGA